MGTARPPPRRRRSPRLGLHADDDFARSNLSDALKKTTKQAWGCSPRPTNEAKRARAVERGGFSSSTFSHFRGPARRGARPVPQPELDTRDGGGGVRAPDIPATGHAPRRPHASRRTGWQAAEGGGGAPPRLGVKKTWAVGTRVPPGPLSPGLGRRPEGSGYFLPNCRRDGGRANSLREGFGRRRGHRVWFRPAHGGRGMKAGARRGGPRT